MTMHSTFTWGANSYGQLGVGHDEDMAIPTKCQEPSDGRFALPSGHVLKITGGGGHMALLTKTMTETNVMYSLHMCGWNEDGQLGLGTWDNASTLTPIPSSAFQSYVAPTCSTRGSVDSRITDVACGWNHTLVLVEVLHGQAEESKGDPSTSTTRAAGAWHSSHVYAFGSNAFGQLGLGKDVKRTSVPTLAISSSSSQPHDNLTSPGLSLGVGRIIQIAAGLRHSLALDDAGNVWCWGHGKYGQLGFEVPIVVNTVTNSSFSSPPASINSTSGDPNNTTTCQRTTSSPKPSRRSPKLRGGIAWTPTMLPQSGNGGVPDGIASFHLRPGEKIIKVAAGRHHSALLTSAQRLFITGDNTYGQLACVPTQMPRCFVPRPVVLTPDMAFADVFCGWHQVFAMVRQRLGMGESMDEGDTCSMLYGWGKCDHGQIGLNVPMHHAPDRPAPVAHVAQPTLISIPGKVLKVATGSEHTLVLAENHQTRQLSLYAWGWNEHGNCGTGTLQDPNGPEKVQLPMELADPALIHIGCSYGHSALCLEQHPDTPRSADGT